MTIMQIMGMSVLPLWAAIVVGEIIIDERERAKWIASREKFR